MLKKVTLSEGRDWDELLPYILFAYREVPQASTGFSPFELLYGRTVRGPLDVVRETWEEPSVADEREKLQKTAEIAQQNLYLAQDNQKLWYDRTARTREFSTGDRVLVLLPTSTSKFRAQWQGPYNIVEKRGDVDYVIDMRDKNKRRRPQGS